MPCAPPDAPSQLQWPLVAIGSLVRLVANQTPNDRGTRAGTTMRSSLHAVPHIQSLLSSPIPSPAHSPAAPSSGCYWGTSRPAPHHALHPISPFETLGGIICPARSAAVPFEPHRHRMAASFPVGIGGAACGSGIVRSILCPPTGYTVGCAPQSDTHALPVRTADCSAVQNARPLSLHRHQPKLPHA